MCSQSFRLPLGEEEPKCGGDQEDSGIEVKRRAKAVVVGECADGEGRYRAGQAANVVGESLASGTDACGVRLRGDGGEAAEVSGCGEGETWAEKQENPGRAGGGEEKRK